MFESSWRSLWCIAAAVVGDRALAEDALQEAALVGLSKLDEFEPGTSYAAWMGQIVRNVSRNMARRRVRAPLAAGDLLEGDLGPAAPETAEPGPITSAGRLEDGQQSFDDRVALALSRLDETARACLLLRTVLDMPYREIAIALGIPEGTAMSHVHRCRQELRWRLSDTSGDESRGPTP